MSRFEMDGTGVGQNIGHATLIIGQGDKDLVEVTVDTDGETGDNAGTVVATDGHPFWVENLGAWVDAKDLRPGDMLRTSAGTWVQVTATRQFQRHQQVHNLTVAGIHTYHVTTANTDTLVHNCSGVHIEVTYKPGWSPAQRAAADAKIAELNSSPMVVTPVRRGSVSAAEMWRRAGNKVPSGHDIDHKIDLQLGGADDVANMWPLDSSVNRSLGSQISAQLKRHGLRPGDVVCSITIRDRC